MGMYTGADAAALEAKYGPGKPFSMPGEKPLRDTGKLLPSIGTKVPYAKIQGICQSIWIPGWTPALLNRVMHGHWANGAKLKKADKQIVAVYFAQSGIAKATGPRRLSMMFVLAKGKRLFDRDAPWKSCKDALAACGAILDDTPALCVDGAVSYARALLECQSGTLLMVEDL